MNKINSKIIYPLVGSIGLTAYLFDNNKYFLNYKNRKLIEELQFKSTVLVMEHYQINKKYGNILTTTLERETALAELNKTKNTLNFEMKVKKGKNLDLDDYFAHILVNSSNTDNLKWNIDSMDIQFKDSKPKSLMRLYESLPQLDVKNTNDDIIYNRIINSSNLNLKESIDCLVKLKQHLPFVLKSIEQLLNDENRLKIIGKPIKLKIQSISESDKVNLKIKIKGEKQTANLYINADRIDKSSYDLSHLGIMYELDEDSFLSTSDIAIKYAEKISYLSSQNPKNNLLFKLLNEINLSKIIEEKLLKNTRALDSIGRPIQLSFDPEKNFDNSRLTIVFNGKLNSAHLIIDLSKDDIKWNIVKSNLKMIWRE